MLCVTNVSMLQVPTTDQATGRVGQEPIRTLGTFRKGSALGYDALPQWRHNVSSPRPIQAHVSPMSASCESIISCALYALPALSVW